MKVVLVTPFAADAARGNSVAARRLELGLLARGVAVTRVEVGTTATCAAATAAQAMAQCDLALILHARHGAAAAAAARAAGIPYVVSLRGTDANEMLADPADGRAIASTLQQAAAITVFHEAMRRQLLRHLPWLAVRIHIVPNGFHLPPATAAAPRTLYKLPPQACVWLSLAGLRAVKRPDFPIAQLARLAPAYPQLRFLRAGPTLERETTQRVAQLLAHAGSWARDCGVLPHEAVADFLAAGDVFVSASRSEGMPHAVREAMASGLALLLADIPGHRALAEPETEALFFNSAASFQDAARRLLDDGALRRRLGAAARRRCAADAAHDEIGAYLVIFHDVLSKTKESS